MLGIWMPSKIKQMEIISILIAIIISTSSVYGIGRTLFTHKQLIKLYREEDMIAMLHLFLMLMLSVVLIIVMTALNEEYWKITV
jgi:hypothetical protein